MTGTQPSPRERDSEAGPSTRSIPWHIDNKYYTADVHFRLQPFSSLDLVSAQDIPIIIYLFSGDPPRPLPPDLTKLCLAELRDIALAIRIQDDELEETFDMGMEEMQEVFEEIGDGVGR